MKSELKGGPKKKSIGRGRESVCRLVEEREEEKVGERRDRMGG